jgi:hypothetical protein
MKTNPPLSNFDYPGSLTHWHAIACGVLACGGSLGCGDASPAGRASRIPAASESPDAAATTPIGTERRSASNKAPASDAGSPYALLPALSDAANESVAANARNSVDASAESTSAMHTSSSDVSLIESEPNEDPTSSQEPTTNEAPLARLDAGAATNTTHDHVPSRIDAASPDRSVTADAGKEPTKSIVYQVEACVGHAAWLNDAGRPKEPVDCDVPGCGPVNRPCNGWGEQSHCEDEAGCRWEVVDRVNEGTDTGKHCQGEPIACEELTYTCRAGCVAFRDENGKRRCEGTPTPCSAFHYSEECGGQIGCEWR